MLDTHAGAGVYDLRGEAARRSGEAAAGVLQLMDDPAAPRVFAPLVQAVRACNGGGAVRLYPGSPWLSARALRPGDLYCGCELRPDDFGALEQIFRARKGPGPLLQAVMADGYGVAEDHLRRAPGRTLLLIDPPFERPDDYARIAGLIGARPHPARQPALIWTPLKDLETFDAFLGALEATGPRRLDVVQARLRPLRDPMLMNGCAMVLVDAPELGDMGAEAAGWIAARLGEPGACARAERLAG